MKDIIEKLKSKVAECSGYKWNDTSKIDISLSDVKKIVEFYETIPNSKEESNPNITPDWDNIPEEYNWVAIDEDGEEFAFKDKPYRLKRCWVNGKNIPTGRKLNTYEIDWTKTLSQRSNN